MSGVGVGDGDGVWAGAGVGVGDENFSCFIHFIPSDILHSGVLDSVYNV